METMNLLIVLITYVSHLKLIEIKEPKFLYCTLYSVLLALVFLSKYSAIYVVIALLGHHLIERRFKIFFITLTITIALTSSWYLGYNFIHDGRLIANFGPFPFAEKIGRSGFVSAGVFVLYNKIQLIGSILSFMLGINGLSLLFPFFLLSITQSKADKKKMLGFLFLISCFIFYLVYGFVATRYLLPLLIVMVPLGVQELDSVLSRYSKKLKLVFISAIALSFLLVQILNIIEFTNLVRKLSDKRKLLIESSLALLKASNVKVDDNVLTDIVGLNVFLPEQVILAPYEINLENKFEVIKAYDIKYVLHAKENSSIPYSIYDDLELVDESSTNNGLVLYKVD